MGVFCNLAEQYIPYCMKAAVLPRSLTCFFVQSGLKSGWHSNELVLVLWTLFINIQTKYCILYTCTLQEIVLLKIGLSNLAPCSFVSNFDPKCQTYVEYQILNIQYLQLRRVMLYCIIVLYWFLLLCYCVILNCGGNSRFAPFLFRCNAPISLVELPYFASGQIHQRFQHYFDPARAANIWNAKC